MSKDLWIAEHERACEDFAGGALTEEAFRVEMRRLGFDPGEIDDHIEALADG